MDSILVRRLDKQFGTVELSRWNASKTQLKWVRPSVIRTNSRTYSTILISGSECYDCICEILDFWWPDDSPNCLKKEMQKSAEGWNTNSCKNPFEYKFFCSGEFNVTDHTGDGTMKRLKDLKQDENVRQEL